MRTLLIAAVVWLSVATARGSTIYDLNSDWSDVSNPMGAWTLRQGDTPLVLAEFGGFVMSYSPQPAWAPAGASPGNCLPSWLKVRQLTPDGGNWEVGEIVMHTRDDYNGSANGEGNVIWTAPYDSTIDISGKLWPIGEPGRDNRAEPLLINSGGTKMLQTLVHLVAYSSAAPAVISQTNLKVAAGDIIQLSLIKTSGAGTFVGVDLTITAEADSPVPEPKGWLLGAGAMLIPWLRRRLQTAIL